MKYEWAEDDFELPYGAVPLGLSQPESNKKYIMYHGTSRKSAQSILANGFRQSDGGMLGRGVYVSRDLQKASAYPIGHPEFDKVVIKVVVNVGTVIAITYQDHPCRKTWHDFGYDTAWVPRKCGMVKSGLEEDCIWDPNRIQIIKIIKPLPIQYRPKSYTGKKLIMYHGTTLQKAHSIKSNGFHQSADGELGPGVYLCTDMEKAKRYGNTEFEYVVKVEVSVGKVIGINYRGHSRQKTWHNPGYGAAYDTAWVPPRSGMVTSGWKENYCVYDPDRIRFIRTLPFEPHREDSEWGNVLLFFGLLLCFFLLVWIKMT